MVYAPSNIQLTIDFNHPDLDEEEKDKEVQKLLAQIKELDQVEDVERVLDPNPPEGNKAFLSFLTGLLMVEVSPANIKKLFGFLGERLGNKAIKLTVKAPNGKEISVEASSKQEFEYAMQKAQDFLNENK